jgi:dienelactone hydrolase
VTQPSGARRHLVQSDRAHRLPPPARRARRALSCPRRWPTVAALLLCALPCALAPVLSSCASGQGALAAAGGGGEGIDENAPPLVPWRDRRTAPVRLRVEGPAPAPVAPLTLGPGMEEVRYTSSSAAGAALSLLAVVARPPRTPVTSQTPVEKAPGLLLLHKGFVLDDETLAQAQAFVDEGFVVMMPTWRGENGNPGSFELWRGELDDARAAARWLAEDPEVDVDRMYAFGHSAGGGLATLLALEQSSPFRLIASSNGIYAVGTFARWAADEPRRVPFDLDSHDEKTVRVLVPNAHEIEQPLLLYVGKDDFWSRTHATMARDRAQAVGKRIEVVELPGDHMASMQAALDAFRSRIVKDAFRGSVALR